MVSKTDFISAMGGASVTLGSSVEVTAVDTDTEFLTAEGHGLVTGDGPFRLGQSGGDLPEGVGPNFAQAILTLTGGNIEATDVVEVGGVYYAFAADPTTGTPDGSIGTPYLVDLGGDDEASLANLASAINADGTPGTTYSEEISVAHTTVAATSDATTLTVVAKTAGTAGNAITVTTTGNVALEWDDETLYGGLAAAEYWVIVEDEDTIALASSEANAIAGTAVNVTGEGSGTITLYPTVQGLADALEKVLSHMTSAGNRVYDPAQNQNMFWTEITRVMNLS